MSTSIQSRPFSAVLIQAAPFAVVILTGFALLWVTGFAPMPEVHDALHDVRHAAGFPCH